jgi:molybdopterin-guanine dinucleotide biosynthesis protein A
LAGGLSQRLGQEKPLILLAGKPLILHVLERVSCVVDEITVVVSHSTHLETYETFLGQKATVVVDKYETRSPLIGALTGFEHSHNEYSFLLPCDTPFISISVASFLLDVCINRNAAIPKWPNGFIEPLQAVYNTRTAVDAATAAINEGELTVQAMIKRLSNVRYISTLVLQQMDPKLLTFFNINVINDLKRAESIIKHGAKPKS